MHSSKAVIACVLILTVVGGLQLAVAQSSKLEGVWKITEVTVTGENARTITNPGASLIIFTKKHYSLMVENVTTDKPRPPLPEQNATDAQKVAAWSLVAANAGTYEIKGTTITTHPIVAKNPAAKQAFMTVDYKIDGNTLTMTLKENQAGPITNGQTRKLIRVE